MTAVVKVEEARPTSEAELTDVFHLVIDALKLNGINTIYGVPGIPVTDLLMQEKDRLLKLEDHLGKRVVGQADAVTAVAELVRRAKADGSVVTRRPCVLTRVAGRGTCRHGDRPRRVERPCPVSSGRWIRRP